MRFVSSHLTVLTCQVIESSIFSDLVAIFDGYQIRVGGRDRFSIHNAFGVFKLEKIDFSFKGGRNLLGFFL